MLVEDIHFLKAQIPPFKLGRKSLAVNISDIAAMGGIPREAVISIAIPPTLEVEYLDSLYDGMKSMAAEFEVNLLGGDTTSSPDRLVINVALIGEAVEAEILYRSGAKVGDVIFLTGEVGDSAAGLDMLLHRRPTDGWQRLLDAHFDPLPHVKAGRIIAGLKTANSMIDVSDGVASDLGHICEESGVGAVIDEDKIPVSDLFRKYIDEYKLDFERLTLHTGEDYVLLATTPEESAGTLEAALNADGHKFFSIGKITAGGGIRLRREDGSTAEIRPSGYDHFRKESE
jgi:thiamine-monophosphate kinase